ncbi:conserved protein, unknown function [Hepatocystis sp. ex Piliocolobus tephrosceles]|nr:conserved protein, unknown function [Hepatocystis sp. ex Piliocolobus tephrosceles]
MSSNFMKNTEINAKKKKFPYCVVFTYLPYLSTFVPIIGHVGICTSSGVIHDFSSSYTISVDDMAFGEPLKYWQLDKKHFPLSITDEFFDEAIFKADEEFSKSRHNLIMNNCHHHVCMALNNLNYKGKRNWTPFKLVLNLFLHGHFVS